MMNVVSVLVENKHGTLLRVAGVLAARGINIERLSVQPTADPGISRIVLAFEDELAQSELLIRKIDRLVSVIRAERLTGPGAAADDLWECACKAPVWTQSEPDALTA